LGMTLMHQTQPLKTRPYKALRGPTPYRWRRWRRHRLAVSPLGLRCVLRDPHRALGGRWVMQERTHADRIPELADNSLAYRDSDDQECVDTETLRRRPESRPLSNPGQTEAKSPRISL